MEICTEKLPYRFIEGQNHFGMPRGPKMSLALNELKNRLLSTQIQALPPRMHHKWRYITNIVCKTTNGRS